MRCTCSLGADAVAGHRLLDLVGRVLHHLAPGAGGDGQGQPAGLPDRHGGAGVDLEEHPLDGHRVGLQLVDQGPQVGVEGGQPGGQGVGRGRGEHARGHHRRPLADAAGQAAVAAPGHPRIDSQDDEHAFETLADRRPGIEHPRPHSAARTGDVPGHRPGTRLSPVREGRQASSASSTESGMSKLA